MKHQKYEIDLSKWNLEALDQLQTMLEPIILKAAGEALKFALEGDETYAYFPVEWDFGNGGDGIGGPRVDNPLTIYVRIGLDSDGGMPTYRFSLGDCVNDFIHGVAESNIGNKTGKNHVRSVERLRDAFRQLADKLDTTLPRP